MSQDKKQITLYSDALGPNGWKVAMVLNVLGVTYDTVMVDVFGTGEGMAKETYVASVNPNGRIPAIVDHTANGHDGKEEEADFTLWESVAIIQYLERKFDRTYTFGFEDFKKAALVDQWLLFQASGQGPYFGQASWFVYYHKEKNITSVIERYRTEVRRVNRVLEGVLSQNGGWLVGGKCTVADLSFVIWTDVIAEWKPVMGEGFDLETESPHVYKWYKAMMALPGVDSVRQEREDAKMRFKS